MTSARPRPFKCSAVISDVDGTLVTDDKILSARSVATAAALRSNGIVFTVISSRPPRGLKNLISSLGIDVPVAGFNGGVLATTNLTIISAHLLAPRVARRTVETLDARGLEVWVFSGQDWLLRQPDAPYVGLEARTVGFGPTPVADFGPALDTAAKIVAVSKNFDALTQCERELRAALGTQASVVRSQSYYLDVTHPRANKGDALSDLAKLLQVPLSEVAAVGDGHNDIAMFERSGLSIAMGNAGPEVQRAADFVTTSNSEDGFAHAIERYTLDAGRPPALAETAKAGDRAW
jgi:Cof subfamily protein (haloacid dehalogenase superfamily)